MTLAFLLAALLLAGPEGGSAAPPAAQAADSALATADRAIAEARAAGASASDLGAAAALLERARASLREGRLDESRRLSDQAWEAARKARESAAGGTRFSVDVGEGESTRIAVSRGTVQVEAGSEKVALPAGQGARSRPGSRLELGPVPGTPALLDPPDGTVITVRPSARPAEPVLAWSAVGGAVTYEIRVTRDQAGREVALRLSSASARAPLRGELPAGDYFWRVAAVDGRGIAGAASSPRRLRVADQPPRLEVEKPVWR